MSKNLIVLNNHSLRVDDDDYISLTDMVKSFPEKNIDNWLRNQKSLEFIQAFEEIYNPSFNSLRFEEIKIKSWATASVKQLKECNIISIRSKSGRYGDTKAHPDIAFEFAMWLDVKFKLWAVQEFQRMKNIERSEFIRNEQLNFIRKETAIEYGRMSKALEDMRLYQDKETLFYHYSNEADMINRLICGMSSKECKEKYGDTPRNYFKDNSEYFFNT
jgi:hypothetical protein